MDLILNHLKPLYLNSKDYTGRDWRLKEDCTVYSNRKLCKYETAADFDCVSEDDKKVITLWFLSHNFKFWVYKSSGNGLHVHFFTKFWSKYHKRKLLELIEDDLGIQIDTAPVMRGWIRAEGSKHPVKGNVKELVYTNVCEQAFLAVILYTNILTPSTTKKVLSEPAHGPGMIIKPETEEPQSIKYMKSHVFADGRNRIMFCLISYWKSKGLKNWEIFFKVKDWLKEQRHHISDHKIHAGINSSTGQVRDRYRLSLLKELGIDLKR